MLYLVLPTGEMQWCDMPRSTMREDAGTLAGLTWSPTERMSDDAVVALALRYGARHPRGLVVDCVTLAPAGEADDIHRVWREGRPHLVGHFGPEFGAKVDKVVALEANGADEELREALSSRDVRPELLEHWKSLGGRVPTVG